MHPSELAIDVRGVSKKYEEHVAVRRAQERDVRG